MINVMINIYDQTLIIDNSLEANRFPQQGELYFF